MGAPDIPAAKRAGLNVDLDRLAAEGDSWLTAEDRYALKTHGVCAQVQPGVFMVRCRVPAGTLEGEQARGLAEIADRYGHGWLHLTTRQDVELHHVEATQVRDVLSAVEATGLNNRSACGHTMRNVMACPDAGVGLEEPFDCRPDAEAVSTAILARSAELNCQLPSRINFAFGGCPACRAHARINDGGFESRMVDGRAGYRLWACGSLGTVPVLAIELADFLPRAEAVAAAEALVEVFVTHGDLDNPKKGRMKFVMERIGAEMFRAAFDDALVRARRRGGAGPVGAEVPAPADFARVLAVVPPGGWAGGVRPQRQQGRAMVTVNVPLGDLDSDDMRLLASLAPMGSGRLHLTRNQNAMFRDVLVHDIPRLRRALLAHGLCAEGADGATDVRACTGSAVCSLGITAAPSVGARLLNHPALARNTGLRLHVSGCPNSCAQHQAADIGLSGAKVRIGGRVRLGYHVWLGADLGWGRLGVLAGRVAEEDVEDTVGSLVGCWEALRTAGESMAGTISRIGIEAFCAHLESVASGFEAGGDEPDRLPAGSAPAVSPPLEAALV